MREVKKIYKCGLERESVQIHVAARVTNLLKWILPRNLL